jgi:hypothetical protein
MIDSRWAGRGADGRNALSICFGAGGAAHTGLGVPSQASSPHTLRERFLRAASSFLRHRFPATSHVRWFPRFRRGPGVGTIDSSIG